MLDQDQLLIEIDSLEQGNFPPNEAESRLFPILTTLLGLEGFSVDHTGGIGDQGIDFLAQKDDQKIAIQQKHYLKPNRSVGLSDLHQMLGSMIVQNISRVMMVSNTRFSSHARDFVALNLPVSFELIDIDALKAWGARLRTTSDELNSEEAIELQAEAIKLMTDLNQELALLIARNPNVLNVIEWRELEKILAEVFSGLGFDVTLTPSSKDGGKDLVLECTSNENHCTYIVEVKHWRSGQKVGSSSITDFLKVILKENRKAGVFLSTYGYCDNAFEHLTEIDRERIRFGTQTKIFTLCRKYSKIRSGIWTPTATLPEILFEQTE